MNISKMSFKKIISYLLIIAPQVACIIMLCNDLGILLGIGLYIVMTILLFLFIWLLNYLFK
jgi:hypothetical protein